MPECVAGNSLIKKGKPRTEVRGGFTPLVTMLQSHGCSEDGIRAFTAHMASAEEYQRLREKLS